MRGCTESNKSRKLSKLTAGATEFEEPLLVKNCLTLNLFVHTLSLSWAGSSATNNSAR